MRRVAVLLGVLLFAGAAAAAPPKVFTPKVSTYVGGPAKKIGRVGGQVVARHR
jgi:hypothetical protein